LASTGVTIAAVEVGLRIGGYESRTDYVTSIGWEKIRRPFPGLRYLNPSHSQFSQEWPSNPRGYFDPETNSLSYFTNNYGFRDQDFSLARPGKIRIAFLGDSFCWGLGVRRTDTFASLIERELNVSEGSDSTFEVYNFGLPGSNTAEEAALYERVARHFRPDAVVVWYFLNDVNAPSKLSVEMWPKPARNRLTEWRKRSRFLDLLVSKMNDIAFERSFRHRVNEAHSIDSPGRRSVEQGLERLKTLTEPDQTLRYLVVIPWLTALDGMDYPFAPVHRAVRTIAEERGFSVLDLLPHLSGMLAEDLWIHRDDHHLNEIGHALVASAFVDYFKEELLNHRGHLLELASSRASEKPHPLDDTLPRNWPVPFAEAIERLPPSPSGSVAQSPASSKDNR
jgi:lysophospholipase L1-like esterase